MPNPLTLHRFTGSHREIGRQHGSVCSELVAKHLDMALDRLSRTGIGPDRAAEVALRFRPSVREHAGFLDEEIVGLAEGAGISVAEAYLLQVRAEVYAEVLGDPGAANECTTFVVLPEATATGKALAGQNADLPDMYADLMIVMHLVPDDGPHVLMATPAGQISYIGMSDAGMATFANFLHCDGWGPGFPRYLFSRYALAQGSTAAALAALRALPRAASRNLIMVDAELDAVDFENTPTRDAELRPVDGLLSHTNHYLAPELADEERSVEKYLRNSRTRHERVSGLLREHHGAITPEVMGSIMRNRDDAPDALSVQERDDPDRGDTAPEHYMTVTGVIAEPAAGRMWVTAGPPSQAAYVEYSFAEGQGSADAF
ncbi:C45 family autoproteolytic acyltransferase/hydolase [Pseudonocardia sp. TRM90224]|uniref:C45 family autoproteolytic acyltransferase/hydolase n=1 Tax=Pseudonocardia sp. TRM90224 TaxID=2812678 RepID=UPI001E458C0A|nr:C45 family peptidase [Pseudonocardia sp. TRM90224]